MIHRRSYPVYIPCTSALTMETHPNGQDKSSLQLGGGALQSLLDCPNS